MARPKITLRIETMNMGVVEIKGVKPVNIEISRNNLSYVDKNHNIFMQKEDIMDVYLIRESMLKSGRVKNEKTILWSSSPENIGLVKILILV